MMKTFPSAVLALLFATTSVWAGTVTFNPPEIDVGPEGGRVIVQVFLTVGDLEEFDATSIVFGSDTMALESFAYDESFLALSTATLSPAVAGVYLSDLLTGGVASDVYGDWKVLYGTLAVVAPPIDPGALVPRQHVFRVDDVTDAGMSWMTEDSEVELWVQGNGFVNVAPTPEPAALTLLGLATLGFLRRPRSRPS